MTRITVFGEALVDLVGQGGPLFRAVPGGGPANVAIGLSRLDVPATLVTGLGGDAFGRLVAAHVTGSGVRLETQPAPFTGMAVVTLDDGGVPAYDFALSWEPATPAVPAGTVALVTGSLTAALAAPQTEAAMSAARPAATVCYDPNIRPAFSAGQDADQDRVARQAALSDVVKASAEDLAWLHPGVDPVQVARDWLDSGPAVVVVTRGADGCTAVTRSVVVDVPAPQVAVADTIGAGDAFMSGLLAGLHAGGLLGAGRRKPLGELTAATLEQLLTKASAAAALTCARHGADPPTTAELAAWSRDGAMPARATGSAPGRIP